ncbi:hypothetical protein [Anaerosolibacter sp.]|uniref:hypothetical protein n=1 Tax=Anaerosolibacter sp. TaxID=1872527 RepID=UPI002630048D|nr:hypothetical protein [Anaerosolibacter sp.]
MDELTREELDYLYDKPKKSNMIRKINSFIGITTVELMVLLGLFIFLWDRVIKYNW